MQDYGGTLFGLYTVACIITDYLHNAHQTTIGFFYDLVHSSGAAHHTACQYKRQCGQMQPKFTASLKLEQYGTR